MADILKDALGIVRVVAPALATALGGPLAGLAVNALASALDKPGAGPAEISRAITEAGPETLLKLKAADQAFAAQMRQLDIQMETVNAGDRASARGRQISMHDHTPSVLAYALTIGFFGLIGILSFHPLPAENKDLVNILLGALGTAWVASMSFFFGSSSGSRSKDAALADSVPADTLSRVTDRIQSILPASASLVQPVAEAARRVESRLSGSHATDSSSGG